MSDLTVSRTFRDAIRSVIPHASTDRTLRVLCAVRIKGDTLYASDRFTACWSKFTPSEDVSDVDVVISVADARTLAKVDETPTIKADTDSVTFTYPSGQAYTFARVDGEDVIYPNVQRLWSPDEAYTATDAAKGVAFDPRYVARLGKVAQKSGRPMVMRLEAPTKPARFDFEDHTSVLIVPIRFAA